MIFLCFLTALIWGVTNSFLKRGSTGLKTIHSDNRLKQFFAELYYFFTNAQVRIEKSKNQIDSFFLCLVLDSIRFESMWFDFVLLHIVKNR